MEGVDIDDPNFVENFHEELYYERERDQPFATLKRTQAFVDKQYNFIKLLFKFESSANTPEERHGLSILIKYSRDVLLDDLNIAILSYPDCKGFKDVKKNLDSLFDFEVYSNSTKRKKQSKRRSRRRSRRQSRRISRRRARRQSMRSKRRSCKKLLSDKIAINMREYKAGRYVSRPQALAVSYSQIRKKYPRCSKSFGRSRRRM